MKDSILRRSDCFRLTLLTVLLSLQFWLPSNPAHPQTLTKIRIGYSGTGDSQYILELPRRQGIFQKNGLEPEIVYVNSGTLLSQALIAGNFDVALTRGSTPMLGKLRGSEQYIIATYSNHFNDVFLTTPEITTVKQLKGKKVAGSRFGSGSHILQPGSETRRTRSTRRHSLANRQFLGSLRGDLEPHHRRISHLRGFCAARETRRIEHGCRSDRINC